MFTVLLSLPWGKNTSLSRAFDVWVLCIASAGIVWHLHLSSKHKSFQLLCQLLNLWPYYLSDTINRAQRLYLSAQNQASTPSIRAADQKTAGSQDPNWAINTTSCEQHPNGNL